MRSWLIILGRAVQEEGSQAAVARKLGLSPATISQVLSGTYQSSTEAVADKVLKIYGGKNMTEETIPNGYKRNAAGHLVPLESIKEIDLARDSLVAEIIKKGNQVSAQLAAFKASLAGDLQAFLELSAEKYGAKLGGVKGNVTICSFDGRYQVMRAIADQLTFDERLQAAKALIDECLREWTKDSGPEIRALIDEAFQVDKKGRVNTKRILGLRKLKIDHPKWLAAMEAISDAVQVVGSCTYFRLYERDQNGNYQQIPMDLSSV